jgi:predicted RNA methylase
MRIAALVVGGALLACTKDAPPVNVPPPAPAPIVAAVTPPNDADAGNETPDIEYVPTPMNVLDKMFEVAKIRPGDVLYDLGCGDGRLVVQAAKRYGIKGIGFDVDPQRIKESNENAKTNGVEHLVRFEKKNIFEVDLGPATVVTLYLLPELNVKLIPQLEKLRPGSRIVSHDFDMEGVEPEKWWTVIAQDHQDKTKDREHYVYLWRVPLKKTKP